jgi:hypothetical protein
MSGIIESFVQAEIAPIRAAMATMETRVAALEARPQSVSIESVNAIINARAATLMATLDQAGDDTDKQLDAIAARQSTAAVAIEKQSHMIADLGTSLGKIGMRLDQDQIIVRRLERRIEEFTSGMEVAQREAVAPAPAPASRSVKLTDMRAGRHAVAAPVPAPPPAPSETCPSCGAADAITRKAKKRTVCNHCSPN